jgi:bifunctional enzyme Fae/Hps
MSKNKYLQLAFNNSFSEFARLISHVPIQENIIIEAGTPLIKKEGVNVIRRMRMYWPGKICSDIKLVDGSEAEVRMSKDAGADYITAIGTASDETLRLFVDECRKHNIKSVIDMINTPSPMKKLWKVNNPPDAVLIHRGRDEENSFGKVIQYKEIAKIKGKWDIRVGAAGGIDKKELQSAVFNGADIVVVNIVYADDPWKGITVDKDFRRRVNEFVNFAK